ncbi:MAG: SMP-30/gluconolactonase/LRE family protein [Pseudomonadota bacterium]
MKIECIYEARAVLGEGALWSPQERALYWIDQMRPEIHRLDVARGADTQFYLPLPEQLGAVLPRAGGGFVLAASDGISFIDTEFRTRTAYVNPIADTPRASFNDAKCDRQGRLWAGTTDRLETEKVGALFRIDRGNAADRIVDGFICSNGPSFSPDGRVMYHSRTHDRAIYAHDIDPVTGEAGKGRVFATIEPEAGVPDGSTVDAEGYLWSTHWGGARITRYAPDGSVDRVIEMPVASPTSCAFGGPDMTTLFVTSASIRFIDGKWVYLDKAGFARTPMEGAIFAIATGIRGLPEPAFRA